ncbi:ABC transporter permease [Streptomyces sp. NPDC057245]|uniref:ABC transporter permease n=1 Tax=Streptomyces TaxID=1883 RepID=UPI001C1E0119|nr:ABC transporter permease [Streptomyces sp. A108]MBU6531381.1 ABC transporter permease [Streptomyces sp. A108]
MSQDVAETRRTRLKRPAVPRRGRREAPAAGPPERTTLGHSVRAEWIKLRTMRSALYAVLATVCAGAGLGTLGGSAAGEEYAAMSAADRLTFDPLATSLKGVVLGQLVLALMGGLAIASEYGSRTIVSTLTAVPRRGRVLVAKIVVVVAVALPTGLLTTFGGLLAGQAALESSGAPHLALGDAGTWRAVLGGGLHLVLAAVVGLAAGTLIRSTTATVTTLFVCMAIVPALAPALPGVLADWTEKYWPSSAGGQILTAYRDPALLDPWPGLAVMAACAVLLLTAALFTFRRRDA